MCYIVNVRKFKEKLMITINNVISESPQLTSNEIQETRSSGITSNKSGLAAGYVINNEGLTDVYSIEPVMYVEESERSGFTVFAEKLNGRLAMIGFISLLALEVFSGHGLLWWLINA